MTAIPKLLARLNPTTVRYDVGRGGGEGMLTAQDIAAALAMVPAGVGRELLCALWWPDGARLNPAALDMALAAHVRAEDARRHLEYQKARVERQSVEEQMEFRRSISDQDRRDRDRAKAKAETAKARLWPTDAAMHVRVRAAVLDELRNPPRCRACGGCGEVTAVALRKVCANCEGTGLAQVSDRTRARAIGRDESNYRRFWRDLFEFVMAVATDSISGASAALIRAIGRSSDE